MSTEPGQKTLSERIYKRALMASVEYRDWLSKELSAFADEVANLEYSFASVQDELLKVRSEEVSIRLDEAERWHFEEWPNHKNQQTCETVVEDWQGYVPQLYEGCKRIVELRALARQQAGETPKGDR